MAESAYREPATPAVAAIGCGYWGRNLVRNAHELGALHAVCDANGGLAAEMAGRYDVPAVDFSGVLASPEIDAVMIAAPAEQHYALARSALLAGKHVFVEKPLALHVAEGEELCELADREGRVLMVGHLLQYHPVFLKLLELVGIGELGRIQYIYSNRLNLGKFRREENILWSFAPHDISMILALIRDVPERVSAVGASYLHRRIADVTTTHLSFPGGEEAHVFVSWLHPVKEQRLVVVGDRKMAVFDDGQPWPEKLLVYPHRVDWREGRPEPFKGDATPVAVEAAEPLAMECSHFLDCVTTGAVPRTDGREGVRVLRVLNAAEDSMREDGAEKAQAARPAAAPAEPESSVHESAYVDQPCDIGAGTRIWHYSHVMKGARIGRDCVVGQNVMVGRNVMIGDRCKIQNNVSIYEGVTLEDGVFCGPSCVFTNVFNPRAEVERKNEFRPTLVGQGATIGANATIVCGANLGAYCLVGAGAVVTRDVPAHALVAGVPARQRGWVSHAGEILDETLRCPRTGQRYRFIAPEQLEAVDDDSRAASD